MTTQIKRRRGTATQHGSFTGAEAEITVNTTNESIHVHDGSTAGGFELARADGSNVTNYAVGGTLNVTGETTLATHLNLGDNDKIKLGASGDLEIFHDGSNSIISDEGTGNLILRGSNELLLGTTAGQDILKGTTGGDVKIYHNNSEKIATTSNGVTVTGGITFGDGHTIGDQASSDNLLIKSSSGENIGYDSTNGTHLFYKNGSELARLSDNGNLCIGRTGLLTDFGDGRTSLVLQGTGSQDYATIQIGNNGTASNTQILGILAFYDGTSNNARVQAQRNDATDSADLLFSTRANGGSLTERMRIDSSGRVGINTSSPASGYMLHVGGSSGVHTKVKIEATTATGQAELDLSADPAGVSYLNLGDENSYNIGYLGYFHSDNSMRFQTNSAERMRIDSSGNVHIGHTTANAGAGTTTQGVSLFGNGAVTMLRADATVLFVGRTNDGEIVALYSGTVAQGNISVSGTTVSFNGGHLSRWSQLADNTRDNTLVKGTVMTNLDQMAEWTTDGVTEDNEQLNCMAVSSVEGDANVAGVFVNWDNDDDVYTNDMNVAMTGDMVIRIAQGVTVARGDLLMSAGDGTAKPQGDDIVRSKTIAKVTSTNKSHTYDDGTYLVPCVLMAC